MNTAKNLGLTLSGEASAYLQQVVGNRLGDLYSELEKLYLRYGRTAIGIEEIRQLAIYSRIYNIFELMDEVSFKHRSRSLAVLNRFLEEEGKEVQLRVLGMLNRQIRLLWHAKSIIEGGGKMADVARKIRLPANLSKRVVEQSRCWSNEGLERAIHQLYEADGLLKSGSRGHLVLEELVLSLCA
jgi:DNA polymerase-3 subunit delta